MNTAKRITIQFILICLLQLLRQADEEDYKKAVCQIRRSNIPDVVKRNLIENGRREEHEVSQRTDVNYRVG